MKTKGRFGGIVEARMNKELTRAVLCLAYKRLDDPTCNQQPQGALLTGPKRQLWVTYRLSFSRTGDPELRVFIQAEINGIWSVVYRSDRPEEIVTHGRKRYYLSVTSLKPLLDPLQIFVQDRFERLLRRRRKQDQFLKSLRPVHEIERYEDGETDDLDAVATLEGHVDWINSQ